MQNTKIAQIAKSFRNTGFTRLYENLKTAKSEPQMNRCKEQLLKSVRTIMNFPTNGYVNSNKNNILQKSSNEKSVAKNLFVSDEFDTEKIAEDDDSIFFFYKEIS